MPAASAPLVRNVARNLIRARAGRWPPYSRLFAVGDRGRWSVDEDALHLEAAAERLGWSVGRPTWARFTERQSVFLTSHFEALEPRWHTTSHRLATAYLHGRPGTRGHPEFDRAYAALAQNADRFSRVQVTHAEMRDLVLAAGVEASRVHLIRIGVDLENFPLQDAGGREEARRALAIPLPAFVVGSFQKDGVGWEEGLEPKLVKGPDVLVQALERVHRERRDLLVLLTGPARGYVRGELERRGIPFVHSLARTRGELAQAYAALDVYLVASRQEGGPKAVLEAMAVGVPLVSTRVGQAQELVEHDRNGWLADVEDADSLARLVLAVGGGVAPAVLARARATAEEHANERLDPRWEALLDGFVEKTGS